MNISELFVATAIGGKPIKTKTYANPIVDSLRCSDGFSEHQTGVFSLPVKGLHGLPLILGCMRDILYKENLYIASEHQNIGNLLFLFLNNCLRRHEVSQRIKSAGFFCRGQAVFLLIAGL